MKKLICILSLILVAAFSLTSSSNKSGLDDIMWLNHDSFMGIDLLTSNGDLEKLDNYNRSEGYGCYVLVTLDEKTDYTVSGFPDCLDDYKMTQFSTIDYQFNVLGISVGMNIEDAKAILNSNKYKYYKATKDEDSCYYKKGKVRIILSEANNMITKIEVKLEVTNKDNVNF